jgi:hypothetical protein
VPLGNIDAIAGNFIALENAMAEASKKYPQHDLPRSLRHRGQDFIPVMMTHQVAV